MGDAVREAGFLVESFDEGVVVFLEGAGDHLFLAGDVAGVAAGKGVHSVSDFVAHAHAGSGRDEAEDEVAVVASELLGVVADFSGELYVEGDVADSWQVVAFEEAGFVAVTLDEGGDGEVAELFACEAVVEFLGVGDKIDILVLQATIKTLDAAG